MDELIERCDPIVTESIRLERCLLCEWVILQVQEKDVSVLLKEEEYALHECRPASYA